MAVLFGRSWFEIIPSYAIFCFASDDVGMQHLYRILVLKRTLSATGGGNVAADLILWLVSLEFRRMPNAILQYFL